MDYMWLLLNAMSRLEPYPDEDPVFRGVSLDLTGRYNKNSRGYEFTWNGS